MPEPKFVYSRSGKQRGELTGSSRPCRLESCRGQRLGVRWKLRGKKSQITFPCTKGMKLRKDGQWQIG